MTYTGTPKQQATLRIVLTKVLDKTLPPAERRSGTAIARSVNHFLMARRRENECIDPGASEKSIREFAKGSSWPGGHRTKTFLWEMFVSEGILAEEIDDTPASVELRTFASFLHIEAESRLADSRLLTTIVGKYLLYKRAVNDPDKVIVRGLIEFQQPHKNQVGLRVVETHVNKTHRHKSAHPSVELWRGFIFPRENAYAMIVKETKKGTPKMSVLDIRSEESGKASRLAGYSIECNESWGVNTIFATGVFLERVNDDTDPLSDDRIDLVLASKLREDYAYVSPFLKKI